MTNEEKVFKKEIAETIVKLASNPYRDYSEVSVKDEFETARDKITRYGSKDINPELLVKYSKQMSDAMVVLKAYESLGKMIVELESVGRVLYATTAYAAFKEMATLFDVPLTVKSAAMDSVASSASTAVRGIGAFVADVVTDSVRMVSSVMHGSSVGTRVSPEEKKEC